jgi:DnaJ-domain-containing protein 1
MSAIPPKANIRSPLDDAVGASARLGPRTRSTLFMREGDTPLQPADDNCDWFAVLGVSESATIEAIRQAYKALIKQNHPDRVHNMSPALRKFAESQTKMIN